MSNVVRFSSIEDDADVVVVEMARPYANFWQRLRWSWLYLWGYDPVVSDVHLHPLAVNMLRSWLKERCTRVANMRQAG